MLTLFRDPGIAPRLERLRDRTAPRVEFRTLLYELSELAAREMALAEPLLVVAVLRAGLVPAAALARLHPSAPVAFVGVERDHATKAPVPYYEKIPPDPGGPVVIADPMLATGGTVCHTIDLLKARGFSGNRIRVLATIVAPEGLAQLEAEHPEAAVHAAALDSHLDASGYIVPGLGDAGERLFGI